MDKLTTIKIKNTDWNITLKAFEPTTVTFIVNSNLVLKEIEELQKEIDNFKKTEKNIQVYKIVDVVRSYLDNKNYSYEISNLDYEVTF